LPFAEFIKVCRLSQRARQFQALIRSSIPS
jgi:hypothetical protein